MNLKQSRSTYCKTWVIMLLACVVFSCKKSDPDETPAATTPLVATTKSDSIDVYIAGFKAGANGPTAVYWKNNTIYLLPNPFATSVATGIVVKDKDVYVSGSITASNGQNKAVYWKNGEIKILADGNALDIAVQGNDVYVCGRAYTFINGSNSWSAAYWKNGIKTLLKNPVPDFTSRGGLDLSSADAITVVGNDVYLAGNCNDGYGGGHPVAAYWKNAQTAVALTFWESSFANFYAQSQAYDIAVQGSDVYVSGHIRPSAPSFSTDTIGGAVYWKNGKAVPLYKNSIYGAVKSIAMKDTTLYMISDDGGGNYYQYKNKTATWYGGPNQYTNLKALTLFDGAVYIAGESGDVIHPFARPGYWRNGKFTVISEFGYEDKAYAICVVKN